MNDVAKHYDILIDEDNDPVFDPEPLKKYMDKWDGQAFIDDLMLDKTKSVFELGVGTGRLAVRVAPLCGAFTGIDISSKTAERARENLKNFHNAEIVYGDFSDFKTDKLFDVVYSSLTFMHINEKQKAIEKISSILNIGGRFVLSVDKNQDTVIDSGTSKITVFPDNPNLISNYITKSGMKIIIQRETDFAHIFVAEKTN